MHIFYFWFASIVRSIVSAFDMILLIYCVSSWFIRDPFNKFMRILSSIVDPVLDPIRNILNRIPVLNSLPIDFSVLVAFFLCQFLLSIL